MTCERIWGLLSAYLEGDLTVPERRAVGEHLASCPACASLLALLRETGEALAGFPEVEPSAALLAGLYAVPEKKRLFRPIFDFLLRPSLQPVYAAFTVLFIALSFVFFHPEGRGLRKAIDLRLHQGYSEVGKIYSKAGSLTGEIGEFAGNVVNSFRTLNPLKGEEGNQ